MNAQNPYDSPTAEAIDSTTASTAASRRSAKRSPTDNTVLPRHIAAILDNVVALTLGVLAAKSIEGPPGLQVAFLAAVYLGYYLLFEGFTSRTPGKLLTGLVVIQVDGQRCTWRQTLIRTAFRIVEVNPFFMIPAALSIDCQESTKDSVTSSLERSSFRPGGEVTSPKRCADRCVSYGGSDVYARLRM